jgi:RNA polymerase-binding transcription factor DksA
MKCKDCGNKIPFARLRAVPGTEYCVECADNHTKEQIGFMVYDHKTAPSLVIIDADDEEALRRASRADKRSRD